MTVSQGTITLDFKLSGAGAVTAGLKAVRGEYQASMTSMARTGQTQGARIKRAYEVLQFRSSKQVGREIQKVEAAYNRLARSGTASAADLHRAKVQLRDRTRELKNETSAWAGSIQKAQSGFLALAGVGYTALKAYGQYSDFAQKMAEVNTLLDVSPKKFAALSDEILKLTKRIPQTATELAAAQYDIISAGVALEKSVSVLELSSKAAVAGVTDTKTAVNVGIGVLNAYGMEVDRLGEVYDILFQTVRGGVTTFPELAAGLGQVLPTARAAGVGIKEVSASIAEMTKAGIRTPQAVTALTGAINALVAPTPEAKKQFDALGIAWKGWFPTLKQIAALGLSIDQMRLLIPDVNARTGVLALTQRMEELGESLDDMGAAGGAMEDAYDKMADTPENQIKLFKNEISALMIELGALVSKVLLPAARGIRWFKDAIAETDTPTRTLLSLMGGYAAIFVMWKMGLGRIVLGLQGMIVQSRAAAAAIGGLKSQFVAASLVMKSGLVVSVAFTGVEVYRAIQGFRAMRKAQAEASEAQERFIKNADRMIERFREFKDARLPDDFAGMAEAELAAVNEQLIRARAYWTAMLHKMEETGDEKGLREAKQRLKEVNDELTSIRSAGSFEAVEKAAEASEEAIEQFGKTAKEAYESARREAEKYAQEALQWDEKLRLARMSTEDRIRELTRKGMSDEQAWLDRKLQAEEKLAAAKEALRKKDYSLAEKLAKDAENLFAGLATEVTAGTGKDSRVVRSIEQTIATAKTGMSESGRWLQMVYAQQAEAARSTSRELDKTADEIEKLVKEREAKVTLTVPDLEKLEARFEELAKPITKTVTIKTVEAHAAGGRAGIGMARGGRFPGNSKFDSIHVMARPGEGFVRNEALSVWDRLFGPGFFEGVNNPWSQAGRGIIAALKASMPTFQMPVPAAMSKVAYATGGRVGGGMDVPDLGRVELAVGGRAFPVYASRSVVEELKSAIQRERLMKGN